MAKAEQMEKEYLEPRTSVEKATQIHSEYMTGSSYPSDEKGRSRSVLVSRPRRTS